jgi:hypothetical protein
MARRKRPRAGGATTSEQTDSPPADWPKRVTWPPARAGNRRFGSLSTRRTHTNAPYKNDLLWETLRALHHPRRAWTVTAEVPHVALDPGQRRDLVQLPVHAAAPATRRRELLPAPETAMFGR